MLSIYNYRVRIIKERFDDELLTRRNSVKTASSRQNCTLLNKLIIAVFKNTCRGCREARRSPNLVNINFFYHKVI